MGKASADEDVVVPYTPQERLQLLSDATENAIGTTVKAHAVVAEVARQKHLRYLRFEPPRRETESVQAEGRQVALNESDTLERLSNFQAILARVRE